MAEQIITLSTSPSDLINKLSLKPCKRLFDKPEEPIEMPLILLSEKAEIREDDESIESLRIDDSDDMHSVSQHSSLKLKPHNALDYQVSPKDAL